MYKFSFRIKHTNCAETLFSENFPNVHITVMDIQSENPQNKQYVYSIYGFPKQFDAIISYLKSIPKYTFVEEIERKNRLIVLVKLKQKSFIQNAIQRYHGFLITAHTLSKGWEQWDVGLLRKDSIPLLRKEIQKMGVLQVVSIREITFSQTILTENQKKIFLYALEQGYYETPRKIHVAQIAKAFRLHTSTVGEHLSKAENKVLKNSFRLV
ncbi:MAG TPA: hypothetical protein HA360_02850 [Nanoarchaeota archaeon]|nr:helix-turn-helix domain-containing protein [Candidatus Woesearchaeota archaeon]HIH15364.1 hypothetical protein [Nanoarchaeota archaeon]HIH58988.1 hypothetical protein [Nanoarchaeota archaeon]HII13989.1 hypothetical protein [Nanoarchaeota archaeon]HIJ05485.1 hypothetical protein [Nanoarchaeota archaeon]